jgi:hypothetical protein
MLTVACVLRSGGTYGLDYVVRLAKGVERNLPMPHRFLCLTDRNDSEMEAVAATWGADIEARRLRHNWPGWWAKMEVYGIPGPVLYFDLDTVIVGDLAPLAEAVLALKPETTLALLDFYSGLTQTGILGWTGIRHPIMEAFEREAVLGTFDTAGRHQSFQAKNGPIIRGDAEWIRRSFGSIVYAQNEVSGIYSFKVHVRPRGAHSLPPNARVVCFHGQPRPADVTSLPWVIEHWGPALD